MSNLEQAAAWATIASAIVQVAVLLAGSGFAVYWLGHRKFRKARDNRLYKNVSRPFAVISTEQQPMSNEIDLLERSELFFKPKHFGVGGKNLQLLDDIKPRLLVVGYSPNSATYKAAFDYARAHSLPFVVFTPQQITDDQDRADIFAYSFGSLCQSELRLVSDVFSVMSTFPEDK
jgi:hypothetical protein